MSGCFTCAKTCVFWDIEDFPVRLDGDLNLFRENLSVALENGSFRDMVKVMAYYATQTRDENDRYRAANIPIVYQTNDKRKRLNKMLLDIDHFARRNHTSKDDLSENTKVLVIAKDVTDKDSLFVPILKELNDLYYEVNLVVPHEEQLLTKEVLTIPPIFVWTWGSLFHGGPPIGDGDYYELSKS